MDAAVAVGAALGSWAMTAPMIALRSALRLSSATLALLLRALAWPIISAWSIFSAVVPVVLAPLTHTMRFVVVAPVIAVVSVLPGLEPLYIFFGTATIVGLLAGSSIFLTSTTCATMLSMHDAPNVLPPLSARRRRDSDNGSPTSRSSTSRSSSSTSFESDWFSWSSSGPPARNSAVVVGQGKRKVTAPLSLLLQQTILEEDSDD